MVYVEIPVACEISPLTSLSLTMMGVTDGKLNRMPAVGDTVLVTKLGAEGKVTKVTPKQLEVSIGIFSIVYLIC